jgi:hypothetical protein
MKKVIKYSVTLFSVALALFMFSGCLENVDLTTENALEGGMVKPTGNIPYKLGATPSVAITITIPKGPAISSIEVYNTYYDNYDTLVSNEVLMTTVDVGGANSSADVNKTLSLTYADLKKDILVSGAGLPDSELELAIANAWVLKYVSVMSDGRKVVNNANTNIGVANQYAGSYQCTGIFHHPTAGDRPINEEKYLTPVDAFTCWTWLGDLGSSGYDIYIKVESDNSCTVTAGPNHVTDVFMSAGEVNAWDPVTGVFTLHYYYVGSTGNRVVEETYTPITK